MCFESIKKKSMFSKNHASIYTQGSGKFRNFEGISKYWFSFVTTLSSTRTFYDSLWFAVLGPLPRIYEKTIFEFHNVFSTK